MKTKNILQIFIFIIGFLGIIIGSSYAVFVFAQLGTTENTISTGSISFSFSEDTPGIEIIEAMPISDAAGKVLLNSNDSLGVVTGYFDFSVSSAVVGNATISYSIFIDESKNNTLNPEHVKIYLTDPDFETAFSGFDGSSVPVVSSFTNMINVNGEEKRSIYSSNVTTGNYSQKFRLRIWVAEEYAENILGQSFQINVGVQANG